MKHSYPIYETFGYLYILYLDFNSTKVILEFEHKATKNFNCICRKKKKINPSLLIITKTQPVPHSSEDFSIILRLILKTNVTHTGAQ